MSDLKYNRETLFTTLQIIEDNKENIDNKSYVEICNMLKDMSNFPKLPPVVIDAHFIRRVLPPTNFEMIQRFNNLIERIDTSINLLIEENLILEKQMSNIQIELDFRQKKHARKKKIEILDILGDIADINMHIKNYNLERERYKERIDALSDLNPDDLYI